MDNNITPVEDFIRQGLNNRFKNVFGTNLLFTNSSDQKLTLAKLREKNSGTTGQSPGVGSDYPYAFASLTEMGLMASPSYKPNTLLRRGLTAMAATDSRVAYKLELIPATTSYEITFISNDFEQVKSFAKSWLFAKVGGWLKYSIVYGVANLDINVEPEERITIPQKEAAPSEVQEYSVVTSVVVHGYLSKDKLSEVQAASSVQMDGFVVPDATNLDQAWAEVASGDAVQVMLFKRDGWNTLVGPQGSEGDQIA